MSGVFFLPVPYIPVSHDGSGDHILFYDKTKKTPELVDAMCGVLARYHIWHKKTRDGVLIPLCLFLDKEMLWNYTTKAEGNAERGLRSLKNCVYRKTLLRRL